MARILAAKIADNAGTIILTCLMLGAAFLVLGLGLWYYRRWRDRLNAPVSTSWTLDDLRKMREQGQLSEQEYQTLRAQLIHEYSGKPQSGHPPTAAGKADEQWDWVAKDEPGAGGFDVKNETPG